MLGIVSDWIPRSEAALVGKVEMAALTDHHDLMLPKVLVETYMLSSGLVTGAIVQRASGNCRSGGRLHTANGYG